MINRKFYRYAPSRYSDSLLSLGNIRIGTLHDFRKSEHKNGIADENEGKKTVTHYVTYASTKDSGDSNLDIKALREFGVVEPVNVGEITVENCTFGMLFDHPDCFIHCSSSKLSIDVMKEFEGADSCVEIQEPLGFYLRLTETLNSIIPVELKILQEVKYGERDEKWNGENWGHHPALIKGKEFSGQYEIRAIWKPRYDGLINPLVLNDTGLLKFLRRAAI